MKRSTIALAVVAAAAVSLFALAGCSSGAGGATSQHQIISSTQECIMCHEEKDTYDLTADDLSSAVTCGTTVTVSTDESSVVVCEPIFTKESGSQYTPQKDTSVSVSDGTATVELDEGIWALCIDEGDASTCVLVVVDASVDDVVEISL